MLKSRAGLGEDIASLQEYADRPDKEGIGLDVKVVNAMNCTPSGRRRETLGAERNLA